MHSFRRRLSLECKVGSIFVAFRFPPLQFSSQILLMPKVPFPIKLLGVCLVAALDLAVHLWASGRDVTVRNAEIAKMPGALRPERRVVIGLDFLNREGEMLTDPP